jgi:adenine deaminase
MSTGIGQYVDAALGRRPLTLLIRNTKLVNVHTGEIYPSSIGVYGDRIVFVGIDDKALISSSVINAGGAYAIPGLIDTHLHVESTMLTPSRFAEAVLPHGTTTAVADPHEIANVLGKHGVKMMIENAKDTPMKLYFFAPTSVPESSAATPGAKITAQDVRDMLRWEGIVGLGEVMDFQAVLNNDERMLDILEAARSSNSVVDGHSVLLSGTQLAAYISAGPDSDHENFTADSMVEKLRAGMYAKLRGPYILNTKSFVSALRKLPHASKVLFVTDDIMPDNLARDGHLDYVCRSFIKAGMDPIDAIRSCTLRPAQHLRMAQLGAISPGKVADILLLKNLGDFQVDSVIANGSLVARGGKLMVHIPRRPFDRNALNTVRVRRIKLSTFTIKPPKKTGKILVNAIDFAPHRNRSAKVADGFLEMVLTKLTQVELQVSRGKFVLGDVALVLVIDRHKKSGRKAFGFAHNLIRRGAVASTVAHDAHNLIVVGTNQRDMYQAAKLVILSQGGIAAVADSQLQAFIDLPIAGLMSEAPLREVAKKMRSMRQAFRRMGVVDHPYIPIVALLTLSVIPHARITDKGIYDVDKQSFVNPYV